jgi:hypothetical protein
MKTLNSAILFASLLATSTSSFALSPHKPTRIHGEGCVEAGAEARCLTVTDARSHKLLYTLLIEGFPPEIGSGIEFIGLPHNGVTTCNQGVAIDVEKWTRKDSLHCTAGLSPQKPQR